MTARQLARDTFGALFDPDHGGGALLANINLTNTCNFRCAHCLMESGPDVRDGWLAPEALVDIMDFVEETRGARDVRINFIGGEPTLRMEVFEMALRMTFSRFGGDATYETTTNGWWLRNMDKFIEVMQVLANCGQALCIRVSASPFHDVYRREEAPFLRSTDHLRNAIEGRDLQDHFFRQLCQPEGECTCCGAALRMEKDGTCCGECGANLEARDYGGDGLKEMRMEHLCQRLAEMIDDHELHVDQQRNGRVLVTGRAATTQVGTVGGDCGWDESCIKFTFNPDASVRDVCCSGGRVPAGHARDGWKLHLRRVAFMRELHNKHPGQDDWTGGSFARCEACPGLAARAMRSKTFQGAVDRALPLLNEMIRNHKEDAEAS